MPYRRVVCEPRRLLVARAWSPALNSVARGVTGMLASFPLVGKEVRKLYVQVLHREHCLSTLKEVLVCFP